MKKSKRKSENTLRQMEMETHVPKSMGCSKITFMRKACSDTDPPQETRKISNKQHNLPSKGLRKRTKKAQSQRREGNNKDQTGNK